jgi:hypothetical protein
VEPIRSHKGEDGQAGSTTLAPDYKIPVIKDNTKEVEGEDNSIKYIWLFAIGGVGYWIYKSRKK